MIKTNQIQKNSIYLFGLLCGVASYITKFYSLKVLINSFTLQEYSAVLAITGISLYIFYNFINSYLKKSEVLSNLIAFVLPIGIIYINESFDNSFAVNTACFVGLLVSTQFIDLNLKLKIKSHFSLLRDSKVASAMTFVEEMGILIPSVAYLLTPNLLEENYVMFFIPLALAILLAVFIGRSQEVEIESKSSKLWDEKKTYSFIVPAITFFAGIMLIRQLQNFGSFMGMQELTKAGYTIGQLFAYSNIVQFILIFSVIGAKLVFQKKNQAWITGANLFIFSQIAFFLVLTFFMSPVLLLGSSIIRKVFAHTTLSESLKLLNSNFPANLASSIQISMNKYGSLFSYVSMSIVSYIFINKVSIAYMWPLAIVMCLGVLYAARSLFKSIIEFQVSNLFNDNVYEAVNSCYGLANKNSCLYSASLCAILKQNHPPILLKAIIYSLGEMKGEGSSVALMRAYGEFKREDIQLEIIEALVKFEDHDVDLFLLRTLEEIITTQTSLGEIRKQIFEAIISRINLIAIPLVLGLLESKAGDERVLANVVMILGEIAIQKNDKDLYDRLWKYTSDEYPRRTRSNALIYLYHQKKYQMKSFGIISEFMISEDVYDQNAAAFLAGELQINSIGTFVFQKSKILERKNSTLEISLLKMGEESSPETLSQIILGADKEAAYTCLNQFNSIKSNSIRYQVYNHIIESVPASLNKLMNRMAASLRNFDDDRMLLYAEAKRLGIKVENPMDQDQKHLNVTQLRTNMGS